MISECCGAEDRVISDSMGTIHYSDIPLCPECEKICNFISEEEFGNEQEIDALTGDE